MRTAFEMRDLVNVVYQPTSDRDSLPSQMNMLPMSDTKRHAMSVSISKSPCDRYAIQNTIHQPRYAFSFLFIDHATII